MLSAPNRNELSDAELTRSYKSSGDLVVLGELYNRYMSLVFGVCQKYLKDREESRDAVMQIFEKLVDSLRLHEVEHFKSWLYVTARNYCLMQLRSRKNRKLEEITPLFMETDGNAHLEQEPELEENLVKLERCMEHLINEQKHCVQLFYLEKKCYKEITTLTGFEMNNVKSYIQNGKRNLKICMERNG
jgi:RNA polymerase sigma-70 factor (ECF subfamily)